MKIYEKFYAKCSIDFIDAPKYSRDDVLGAVLESFLSVDFVFFNDPDFTKREKKYQEKIEISSVDLAMSLDAVYDILNKVRNLRNQESTDHLTPFISVDGDPDDLGIWWTFTKEASDLFLQVDRRGRDSIIFKMKEVTLQHCMLDFVNLISDKLKDMELPMDFKRTIERALVRIVDF